jgi:hypothetical protein
VYEVNARKKGLIFELSEAAVARLIRSACHYCGVSASPTNGIDRIDSSAGYTVANVVTACSICNYAKRDLSPGDFLAWVERIHAYQSLLQRNRSVLLRMAQQPDGCGPHHTGGDR